MQSLTKTFPALALLALLLVLSCKSSDNGAINKPDPKPPVVVDPPVNSCDTILRGEPRPSSSVNEIAAAVVNGCLELKFSYSGGCKDHNFAMYWDGNIAESMPPQVYLHLFHNANGDHCRNMLNKKLKFDLSTLKQGGTKQVVVNISHNGEFVTRVNYEY